MLLGEGLGVRLMNTGSGAFVADVGASGTALGMMSGMSGAARAVPE